MYTGSELISGGGNHNNKRRAAAVASRCCRDHQDERPPAKKKKLSIIQAAATNQESATTGLLLVDVLDDSTLKGIFSYLDDGFLTVGLTCKRFHGILTRVGELPYERPMNRYHPRGSRLLAAVSSGGGPGHQYRWDCCDGKVYHPGCIEDGDCDYCCEDEDEDEKAIAENDRVREVHDMLMDDDGDDDYRDSEEWCNRRCGCGHGDGVYATCFRAGILRNRHEQDRYITDGDATSWLRREHAWR